MYVSVVDYHRFVAESAATLLSVSDLVTAGVTKSDKC